MSEENRNRQSLLNRVIQDQFEEPAEDGSKTPLCEHGEIEIKCPSCGERVMSYFEGDFSDD